MIVNMIFFGYCQCFNCTTIGHTLWTRKMGLSSKLVFYYNDTYVQSYIFIFITIFINLIAISDQFYQDLLKAEVAQMDLKNEIEHVAQKLGKRHEKIKKIDLDKVDRWNRNTHLHNILERQRRQSLRNSFSQLRVHIPSLHDNEKAPKIMILTEALRLIQNLHYMDQKLQTDLELERCRNQMLRERIKLICNFWLDWVFILCIYFVQKSNLFY